MAENSITEKILDHIRQHGPSKAIQIATALKVDRSAVNCALYGPLRGRVHQDRNFRWSLADGAQQAGNDASLQPQNSRASLFSYYVDCLSQDGNSAVRAFADSNRELDYVELEEWPFEAAQPNFDSEPLLQLIGRQRRDNTKKTLWLGYPTLIRHVRSRRGWEGAFLEPLLVWPQNPDAGAFGFLPEPQINTRALEGLAVAQNVFEEAAELAHELGFDAAEAPPLDELVTRLRELRPEWLWKDDLAPARFRGFGELRKIADSGIYNGAVVVIADRSPFTVGLERELADLRNVDDAAIRGSSLSVLLSAFGSHAEIDGPLLEPAPLNAEQRTAARQALTDPLTVITGPPGIGKSQVVTAILINAAWRGLRVLFASKNNKAVDVVMERVNALSDRPVVLRLGSNALAAALAQHITTILSARPTDDDRRAYESILAKLKPAADELMRLALKNGQLLELRNKVDRLERAAEHAREVLPPVIFQSAERVSTTDADARIADLRNALRRCDRDTASFLTRLF